MADEIPTTPAPELPKPERCLTSAEVIQYLGLRSKSALAYLMAQPDGPPFIRLTKRTRVFPFRPLVAWAEARITTQTKK